MLLQPASASIISANSADFGSYAFPTVKKMPSGLDYAIGGNYFMRIGGIKHARPLLGVTPPKVSVGCGGLSFRGMFLAFLGLDDLSTMLSDAGTTVAWGIMLGLVESLPSISQTLEQIQAFVRRIQNLISRACQTGIQIGSQYKNVGMAGAINRGIGNFNALDAKMADKLKKWNSDLGEAFSDIITSGDVTDTVKGNMLAEPLISAMAPGFGIWGRFIYGYMNRYDVGYAVMANAFAATGTADISETIGNIELKLYDKLDLPYNITTGNPSYFRLHAALIMLLQSYGMKDVNVLNHKLTPAFVKVLGQYIDAVRNGDKDKGKEAETLRQRLFGPAGDKSSTIQHYLVRGLPSQTPADLANFFKHGDPNAKFFAPNFTLLTTKDSGGNSMATLIMPTTASVELGTGSGSEWYDLIRSFGDIRGVAAAQVECLTMDTNTTTSVDINGTVYQCDQLPPVFLGSARKMLRVYAQSTTSDQIKIKEAVTLHNEMLMLYAIANGLEGINALVFADYSKAPEGNDGKRFVNTTATDGDDEQLVSKSIKESVAVLREKIADLQKEIEATGIPDFEDYINKLDQRNKQRSLRDIY